MHVCSSRIFAVALTAFLTLLAQNAPAFAHASERGHVLLLPTGYYTISGALAVVASFVALFFLPPHLLASLWGRRLALFRLPFDGRPTVSFLSCLFFFALVYAGAHGSRDPLANPLPLTVWTLLWVGLTLTQGLFGNSWAWLNPWYGPWRLLRWLTGGAVGRLRLPTRLEYKSALLLLFAFAWFELVSVAPNSPTELAAAAFSYWLFTFVGICLFGYRPWVTRIEFLSVFFRMISKLSLFRATKSGRGFHLSVGFPGGKLLRAQPLPLSGVAFLLLALSSVSFDGFMRSFVWLGLIGVNPLEFPGRSAVLVENSAGLLGMFVIMLALFTLAVLLGNRMSAGGDWRHAAGLFVWSIVPIALAYHFSHYVTALLVNGQYAIVAMSDPFFMGWDLFGTAEAHIHAGLVLGARSAWMIWNAQAAAIIAGHVLAVLIAHMLVFRLYGTTRRAALSQLPVTLLMIGYTIFGLWLLSTPTAG